jgi:hypothetical protein
MKYPAENYAVGSISVAVDTFTDIIRANYSRRLLQANAPISRCCVIALMLHYLRYFSFLPVVIDVTDFRWRFDLSLL